MMTPSGWTVTCDVRANPECHRFITLSADKGQGGAYYEAEARGWRMARPLRGEDADACPNCHGA